MSTTAARGDRSYLAHDGQVALLVDPQREVDRMLDLAAARGVRITPVPETHLQGSHHGPSGIGGRCRNVRGPEIVDTRRGIKGDALR